MRVLFLLPICVFAQVEQPGIGTMLDASGALRPVLGIASNVIAGDPIRPGVTGFGCSPAMCLMQIDGQVLAAAPESEAIAVTGPAIFAFEGNRGYAYDPAEHRLYVLDSTGRRRTRTPAAPIFDGEILAMRVIKSAAEFAIRRDGATWIVRDTGAVADSIPSASGPVLFTASGVLYSTGTEIVLRRADSNEIRFPLAGAERFFAMQSDYVQIRADGADYALRIQPGREQLFQLPEPGQ